MILKTQLAGETNDETGNTTKISAAMGRDPFLQEDVVVQGEVVDRIESATIIAHEEEMCRAAIVMAAVISSVSVKNLFNRMGCWLGRSEVRHLRPLPIYKTTPDLASKMRRQ